MFKQIFSFSGRIRRTEYGLSLLLYPVLYIILLVIWNKIYRGQFIFFLVIFSLVWSFLAQGAKRCHDIGYSAFYQFIPFYFLILIFQEGDEGRNYYGGNPKASGSSAGSLSEMIYKKWVNIRVSRLRLLALMSSSVMAYVFCSVLILEYLPLGDFLNFSLIWILGIPFFYFALIAVYKGRPLNLNSYLVFKQRFLFSTFYYIVLRLYILLFTDEIFELYRVPMEILFILMLVGLTWFSYKIYVFVFNKNQVNL